MGGHHVSSFFDGHHQSEIIANWVFSRYSLLPAWKNDENSYLLRILIISNTVLQNIILNFQDTSFLSSHASFFLIYVCFLFRLWKPPSHLNGLHSHVHTGSFLDPTTGWGGVSKKINSQPLTLFGIRVYHSFWEYRWSNCKLWFSILKIITVSIFGKIVKNQTVVNH